MPIPTVRGGTGPLGLVHVNQTLYDPASGMRVTVSEATTGKLTGAAINPELANGFPQVFALRVALDTTESAARNIQVNFSTETGNSGFMLYSSDIKGDATCWTLTSRLIAGNAGNPAKALAAIGGDVAFHFDTTTHYGEGWVACPIVKTDNGDYLDGYMVLFDGAYGRDANDKIVGIGPLILVAVQP